MMPDLSKEGDYLDENWNGSWGPGFALSIIISKFSKLEVR